MKTSRDVHKSVEKATGDEKEERKVQEISTPNPERKLN